MDLRETWFGCYCRIAERQRENPPLIYDVLNQRTEMILSVMNSNAIKGKCETLTCQVFGVIIIYKDQN